MIGLDLFASMGITSVLGITSGLKFSNGAWSHDNDTPGMIFSGSPAMVDTPKEFREFFAPKDEANDVARTRDRLWEPIDPSKVAYKIT